MFSLRRLSPFIMTGLTLLGVPLVTPAQTQPNLAIDPRAEQILRQATDYLKASQNYSFQAKITFDDVMPPDLKLQYHAIAQMWVERPSRLRIDYVGDRRNVSFYYNGKDFTLFDKGENLYGNFTAPPTIDATLNKTLQDFGFLVPLADFAYSDPTQILTRNVKSGLYLGLVSFNGIPTHHLAFTEENIDWQIWIEDGKRPLIHKLVITYKNLTAAPQYIAEFTHWDINNKPQNNNFFSFQAPDNAIKIDFLPSN
ncbi:conserved hypothetical protein [Gloeothece citriformis PCC 7424]|uniref:Periplasmic protein n=1 Tax=Gloeothece citriformis (strain PCC 7424) TaxID=65393 RepID=B7KJD6_GLOC7|nr:DUF2092 domain-containing protein [Gloeothece citriformis]ACK72220.1 conserved hypothetical protein [Gloeothece citriformis PCC 7424]